MKQALKLVFGSCVVYVAMAACASKRSPNGDGAGDTMAGGNGAMQSVGGSAAGSMAMGGGTGGTGRDAMPDGPVPDAMAQPDSGTGTPTVQTGQCTVQAGTLYYAEVPFAGKSVEQLAHAVALLPDPEPAVPGYTHGIGLISGLKAGSVLVYCGANQGMTVSAVLP